MKIYNCLQGSEEWERIRMGKATASQFHRIVTPKKLQLASAAQGYACELACQLLGVASPQPVPSWDMEQGTEREPWAIEEYEVLHGVEVRRVGFVMPDETCGYGCSPDGFIGDDGLIEVKCPKAETFMGYAVDGVDSDYLLQVQGQLWITGRKWCSLFIWHPELEPIEFRTFRDDRVIDALAEHVPEFVKRVREVTRKVRTRSPLGINFAGVSHE